MAGLGPTVTLVFAGNAQRLQQTIQQVQGQTNSLSNRMSRSFNSIGVNIAKSGAQFEKWAAIIGGGGAIAAGGILASLPLAIGAIGIKAVASSAVVQKAFTDLKTNAVSQIQAMAAPIQGVLVSLAADAQKTLGEIGPTLGRMFADVAPMVKTLADSVLNLVTGAMPGLATALGNARPVIDALGRGISGLGPAIGAFFANLSAGAPGAAKALGALFQGVSGLLPVLGGLVAKIANAFGPALQQVIPMVVQLAQQISKDLSPQVIGNLAKAFSSLALATGGGLLSALQLLAPLLPPLSGFLVKIAPILGPIAAGFILVSKAIKAVQAATVLLNVALGLTPIGWIILAIGGLVIAFITLWNKSEGFRNFWKNLWADIKGGVTNDVNWIKARFNDLVGFFSSLPGRIGAFFERIGRDIASPFIHAFNDIRDLWNNTVGRISFTIPSWIPGIGGKGFSMPKFHHGGVVPGSPGQEVMAILQAGETVTPAGKSTGGGAMTINFTGGTDSAFAQAFMKMVRTGQIQIKAA